MFGIEAIPKSIKGGDRLKQPLQLEPYWIYSLQCTSIHVCTYVCIFLFPAQSIAVYVCSAMSGVRSVTYFIYIFFVPLSSGLVSLVYFCFLHFLDLETQSCNIDQF